jgi:AraC-like DNA-binding protein
MLDKLLANSGFMRIIRKTKTWRVLSPSLGSEGCCLQRLAMQLGYRVGEICGVLGCSERYLRTVFLRDVGLSPKEWMRQERMVVACRLLDAKIEPVMVAAELGFASVNNFRREFHQVYGVSPGRWTTRGNIEHSTSNVEH